MNLNFADYKKTKLEDKLISGDVTGSFEKQELLRIYAVDRLFSDTSFKQALVSNCYFRNCTFIRCDFTGAHIKESYFRGSTFDACKFQYTTWEKTHLDEEFIDRCLPPEENLARDLIRSLRVNFSQIGNYEAVNRAAAIEVKLTGQYLYNAAYSKQAYYRTLEKYQGINRLWNIGRHLKWKFLDLLWGNGESLVRVILSALVLNILLAVFLTVSSETIAFFSAFKQTFWAFWGIAPQVPDGFLLILTVARLVFFGLFMAILVKRLSRR